MNRETVLKYGVGNGISVSIYTWIGVLDILLFDSTQVWIYQLLSMIGFGIILILLSKFSSYTCDYLIPTALGLLSVPTAELLLRHLKDTVTPGTLTQGVGVGILLILITIHLKYKHEHLKYKNNITELDPNSKP